MWTLKLPALGPPPSPPEDLFRESADPRTRLPVAVTLSRVSDTTFKVRANLSAATILALGSVTDLARSAYPALASPKTRPKVSCRSFTRLKVAPVCSIRLKEANKSSSSCRRVCMSRRIAFRLVTHLPSRASFIT